MNMLRNKCAKTTHCFEMGLAFFAMSSLRLCIAGPIVTVIRAAWSSPVTGWWRWSSSRWRNPTARGRSYRALHCSRAEG